MEEGRVVAGRLATVLLLLLILLGHAGNADAFELKLETELPVAKPAAPAKQITTNEAVTPAISVVPTKPVAQPKPAPAPMAVTPAESATSAMPKAPQLRMDFLAVLAFAGLTALLTGWWIGGRGRSSAEVAATVRNSSESMPSATNQQDEARLSQTETVRIKAPVNQTKPPARKRRKRSSEPVAFEDHLACAEKFLQLGLFDEAIDHVKMGVTEDPYHLDMYRVGLRIYQAIETPPEKLVRLLKTGLHLLWNRHPMLWERIARDGRIFAPKLADWERHPDDKEGS